MGVDILEIIAFLLLALFIGIAIMVNAFYRRGKQYQEDRSYVMEQLGLQEEVKEYILPVLDHLEQAIDQTYMEQVRERVVREHKISPMEWENRWFEWKRYLLMVAMFRSVPMYSREVDEIWHEMIMFTRDYEQFSTKYLNTTLHHQPNTSGGGFDQNERALFDWMYVTLFKPTPFSHRTWKNFLQFPVNHDQLSKIREQSLQQLMQTLYHQTVAEKLLVIKDAIKGFDQHIKEQLLLIEQHMQKYGTDLSAYSERLVLPIARENAGLAMLQMNLFLSLYHAGNFEEKREKLHKQIGKKLRKQGVKAKVNIKSKQQY